MGLLTDGNKLRLFLNITNGVLIAIGCVCVGVGGWLAADKVFISDIVGNDLFSSATYIIIFSGCVLIIISFVGCLGVHMKNGPILSIYIVCLILIFLLMFAAGIVAALFQGQLESTTKTNMQSAIKNNYGNNIASSSENKRITESWDFFQNRLQCCAVEDYGYTLYRQSHWFSQTNPNVRIQVTGVQSVYNQNPSYNTGTNYNTNYGYHNPDHVVQFIPESCCKNQGTFKTGDWKRFCQSNKFGPPAIVGQRHNNYAMNFKGCYTAAKEFVKDSGAIIIALGFLFAALLVLALVLSIAFWVLLRKTPRHHPVARNDYPVAKEMQNL